VILKKFADKLRSLFLANVPSKGEQPATTALRLRDQVFDLVENMPTMPDAATRAMAVANNPDSSLTELARLIEADATIATCLIRYANSALYSGGAPALKLPQAIVRLGLSQCKNLILSIGIKSLFRGMTGATKQQCAVLWHHGHVTGSLCRQINGVYRLGFEGEEFAAGLLHDLGRVLLVLADADCSTRAATMDFHEDAGTLERERAAIGIDHCALGAWFAEHSQLPDTLIQTIQFHHESWTCDKPSQLVLLVATADHMANHVQLGQTIEAYEPEDNLALAELWLRWPEARKQRLSDAIPAMMAEAVRAAAGEQAV
jgi:HD-like signal output (HDOD) protein